MSDQPIQCQFPCEPPPPTPEVISVVKCDGTREDQQFDKPLDRVVIVPKDPIPVCVVGKRADFEVGCSSVDGRKIVAVFSIDEAGVMSTTLHEADAALTPVTDGSRLVDCQDKDYEDIEQCFELIADNTITYRRVSYVNTITQAVEFSIWFNTATMAVIPAPNPALIRPCEFDQRTINVSNCDGTTTPQSVDGVQGVYVLNQHKSHFKTVYDNLKTTITGNVGVAVSGTTMTVTGNVTASNLPNGTWGIFVDYQNGFTDRNNVSNYDMVNQPEGEYNCKVYVQALTNNQPKHILVCSFTYFITKDAAGNNIVTVQAGAPFAVFRPAMEYTYDSAQQEYCGITPIGSPRNVNGSVYTPIGVLEFHQIELKDELEINPDANEGKPSLVLDNAGMEYWGRISPANPVLSIDSGMINGIMYDSVTINNISGYPDGGDFRPFGGQLPENISVLWVEVEMYSQSTGNYNKWIAVPPGSHVIEMEGASIISIPRIAIANNIPGDVDSAGGILHVKALSNGSAPSSPITIKVTFNLSVYK